MSECIYYCDGVWGWAAITSLAVLALVCVVNMAAIVASGEGFVNSAMYTFFIVILSALFLWLLAIMLIKVPELVAAICVVLVLCVIGWGIGKVL